MSEKKKRYFIPLIRFGENCTVDTKNGVEFFPIRFFPRIFKSIFLVSFFDTFPTVCSPCFFFWKSYKFSKFYLLFYTCENKYSQLIMQFTSQLLSVC